MHSTLPSSIEGLLAERDRLEHLLHVSEEWRALQQLKARSERGEKLTSVSEGQLETLLLDTLQTNMFYKRRSAVLAEIERLNGGGKPVTSGSPAESKASNVHDLKRIRRIDAELERRLHAMNIRSFDQIASWTSADVQNIATTLGLGKRISSENWIEQAALLAPPKRPTPTPAVVATVTPAAMAPPTPQRLSREDALLQLRSLEKQPLATAHSATTNSATAKSDTVNVPLAEKVVEAVLADPPRPAPARAFAPVVVSLTVEEPVETPVVLEQPQAATEPETGSAASPPSADPGPTQPGPLDGPSIAWTKQIETLEAELLDIAFGPDKSGENAVRDALAAPALPSEPPRQPGHRTALVTRETTPPPIQPPPPPPVVDDRFSGLLDREDYAAFRSSVEEARVEIFRSNGHPAAPVKPQPPPPEVPSGKALPPAYPWPMEEPRDDSVPDRVSARFSKALTGR